MEILFIIKNQLIFILLEYINWFMFCKWNRTDNYQKTVKSVQKINMLPIKYLLKLKSWCHVTNVILVHVINTDACRFEPFFTSSPSLSVSCLSLTVSFTFSSSLSLLLSLLHCLSHNFCFTERNKFNLIWFENKSLF